MRVCEGVFLSVRVCVCVSVYSARESKNKIK